MTYAVHSSFHRLLVVDTPRLEVQSWWRNRSTDREETRCPNAKDLAGNIGALELFNGKADKLPAEMDRLKELTCQ